MDDSRSLATDLRPILPLRIRAVEFNDPQLTLIGERWSLALYDWTWHRDGVATDADTVGVEDAVWELCGLQLEGVHFPHPSRQSDCTFTLTNSTMETVDDGSGYETWYFRHDDLDCFYVGL